MWSSGARPNLSLEDEEVKRKLVRCASRAYSELIRLDISGPSGSRPARLPFMRSSPLSVMKPDELKNHPFSVHFQIYFYLKGRIYVQKYGITNQTVMQQGIQEKEEFLQ